MSLKVIPTGWQKQRMWTLPKLYFFSYHVSKACPWPHTRNYQEWMTHPSHSYCFRRGVWVCSSAKTSWRSRRVSEGSNSWRGVRYRRSTSCLRTLEKVWYTWYRNVSKKKVSRTLRIWHADHPWLNRSVKTEVSKREESGTPSPPCVDLFPCKT